MAWNDGFFITARLAAAQENYMKKSKKRGIRRDHQKRIQKKYRTVALRWAGSVEGWARRQYRRGGVFARARYIYLTVRKLANHHNCPCWHCKGERYNRAEEKNEYARRLWRERRGI